MRSVVPLLALVGCGRIAFDAQTDGSTDAAPLPPLVCARTREPLPATTNVDLAATALRDGSGIFVVWSELSVVAPLQLAYLDPTYTDSANATLDVGTIQGVSSLFDTGTQIYMIGRNGIAEVHVTFAYGFSPFTNLLSLTPTATSRDSISTVDSRIRSVHASASGAQIALDYVDDMGPGASGGFTAGNAVTDLSTANGPDHTHLAWRETGGNCFVSGIVIGNPITPMFVGALPVDPCATFRFTYGTSTIDDGALATVTAGGAIGFQHIVATADPLQIIAPQGREPRIAYDGTRYWMAWIETIGAIDTLRIAHVTPGSAAVTASMPMVPAGDEAFELVRDGTRVVLLVREADGLDALTLCP